MIYIRYRASSDSASNKLQFVNVLFSNEGNISFNKKQSVIFHVQQKRPWGYALRTTVKRANNSAEVRVRKDNAICAACDHEWIPYLLLGGRRGPGPSQKLRVFFGFSFSLHKM